MQEFNKFQISKFFGKDYQIVIRTNDIHELMDAMKEAKPLLEELEKRKEQPVSTPQGVGPLHTENAQQPSGLTMTCQIHNVQMNQGWSKTKNKPYFSHDLPEGRCFGKGVLPKSY